MEAPVNTEEAPVDGASAVPQEEMPMDDTTASQDAPMDNTAAPQEEMPLDDEMGVESAAQNNGGDDTVSLFNQLSDKDKESARSYIESMLHKDGESSDENNEVAPQNVDQMAESVIFTKGQLKKINENLQSVDLANEKEDEKKPLQKVRVNNVSKKSPFKPSK